MEPRNRGGFTQRHKGTLKTLGLIALVSYFAYGAADVMRGEDTIPARSCRPILNLEGDKGPFDYGQAWGDYLAARRELTARNYINK